MSKEDLQIIKSLRANAAAVDDGTEADAEAHADGSKADSGTTSTDKAQASNLYRVCCFALLSKCCV